MQPLYPHCQTQIGIRQALIDKFGNDGLIWSRLLAAVPLTMLSANGSKGQRRWILLHHRFHLAMGGLKKFYSFSSHQLEQNQ